MGAKPLYNSSWDVVFAYLQNPGNSEKHKLFFHAIEPTIKHWLLRVGLKDDINGHARSIFSDLYLKERKRLESGKLTPEKCTAQITTYYFPVIKNLCLDYAKMLNQKLPLTNEAEVIEFEAKPGVFESLWGEHKNTLLLEMGRSVEDFIELSDFEQKKKEVLRKRFIEGSRFPEIFNGVEKKEFEAQRKWACRQGKKIASKIAKNILPGIIDCYRIPISKKIDPKIIEKYLLGLRTKLAL